MTKEFDPQTDTRRFGEADLVLHPPQATSLADFSIKMAAWKARYQERVDRLGPEQARLTDETRALILIHMLPSKENAETFKDRSRWAGNLPGLEQHLLQMIHDRTKGAAPMMSGAVVQEDDEPPVDVIEQYKWEADELELHKIEE